jgi:hypothetical protein
MAQIKSQRFNNPLTNMMNGNAFSMVDKATQTVNPTANDTLDFILKAGMRLDVLRLKVPDMDASTGLAGKVGWRPVNGDAAALVNGASTNADDDYFRGAAALGQAAALIDCDFIPVVFDKDVYIAITWTVAASGTFTAGDVWATMIGQHIGIK